MPFGVIYFKQPIVVPNEPLPPGDLLGFKFDVTDFFLPR